MSEKPNRYTFEVYEDAAGEYRWRLKSAGNGEIVMTPKTAQRYMVGKTIASVTVEPMISTAGAGYCTKMTRYKESA